MDNELELRMASAAGNTDAVGKINRRFNENHDDKGQFASGSGGRENALHAKTESEHKQAVQYHKAQAKLAEKSGSKYDAEMHKGAGMQHQTASEVAHNAAKGFGGLVKSKDAATVSKAAHGYTKLTNHYE